MNPQPHLESEAFDPAEILDLNRFPPASADDLTLQQLVRDLAVSAPPADAWQPFLDDLADRTPAARALFTELAQRTRATQPPPPTGAWPTRSARLMAELGDRQHTFDAHAAWLTARTRDLAVPPATADQWAFQAELLYSNLTCRTDAGDQLETIARETPVAPQTTDPDQLHADWAAVEATIRQGHAQAAPPVPRARWNGLWNRIQHQIENPTAAAAIPAAPVLTATAAAPTAKKTVPLRPRPALWRWALGGLAAAAIALLAFQLGRHSDPTQHLPHNNPLPQTANLESAEILDMGDANDSVTTIVRTGSGDNPVTVVVLVSQ